LKEVCKYTGASNTEEMRMDIFSGLSFELGLFLGAVFGINFVRFWDKYILKEEK